MSKVPQLEEILEAPAPHAHVVQLYGSDDRTLAHHVSLYLIEGLKRREGLLVIATEEHTASFIEEMARLGADPEAAVGDGQLVLLDAEATLARFMTAGQPDWNLFESTIKAAINDLQSQPRQAGLRAYGEMVGVLWNAGKYAAAIRLEQFWNRLLGSHSFNLFCAYPIDVFSSEFQIAALDALLCAHTHVVPAGVAGDLETAVNRSMDDILGRRAEGLRSLMDANFRPAWAVIPRAEANILWIRNNLPDEAESILGRAKHYYHASHFRSTVVDAQRPQ
jgi:hypothetical protein